MRIVPTLQATGRSPFAPQLAAEVMSDEASCSSVAGAEDGCRLGRSPSSARTLAPAGSDQRSTPGLRGTADGSATTRASAICLVLHEIRATKGAAMKKQSRTVPRRRQSRRCCTNPHSPARGQPTGFSPADAIRHWSAEGDHPIEDLTAEDHLTPLPGWAPGAKAISDDGLVSEERVLHPALTMVP